MTKCYATNYLIRIEPNFKNFTFNGKVVIHLVSEAPIQTLALNAADLTFNSSNIQTTKTKFEPSHKFDYEEEDVHFTFANEITGEFTLEIDYEGKIHNNLKGLYQTHYKVDKEIRVGGFTQFETEDARRMFPCFDEPGMKATYELEVLIEDNLTVISNMPIKSQSKVNSKKLTKFDKTPKMSSYLVFLTFADYEFIEDKLRKITFRVYTHPGLIEYGRDALLFGMKSLDFCEKYFNIAYPLPKMDLISTPDFSAGAMENWGLSPFEKVHY